VDEIKYEVIIKPKSEKDLKMVPKSDIQNILLSVSNLKYGLNANVKKLTNFSPEYRLRVGNYRVLFEIIETKIIIYRILHRKDVYKRS